MNRVRQLLADAAPRRLGEAIPICWSAARRESLRRKAAATDAAKIDVEPALAAALTRCADGAFAPAERQILALLGDHLVACQNDDNYFKAFIDALFVVQRFDLVAAMLRDRHGYALPFELAADRGGPGRRCVQWTVAPAAPDRFVFDASVYEHDETSLTILVFQWMFGLWSDYSRQRHRPEGSILINLGDIGEVPGLAFSDSRPDRFLIPDPVFVPTRGHAQIREVYRRNPVAWADRVPVAFWRGATTGVPKAPGGWRSLERIRLCELARRHVGLIDAGISDIRQFAAPRIVAEIRQAGVVRGAVPWQDWQRYKYHIDIDGNSNSWSGLFYRLLTGSPVLKIESSRGLAQWFYDRLSPWHNYVPVAPDQSDLAAKVEWLRRNDAAAQRIGERGRDLAVSLTYERESARTMPVIATAFRYFAGHSDAALPLGRQTEVRLPPLQ